MLAIILVGLLIVGLSYVLVLIYYKSYSRYINSKVVGGDTDKKRMPDMHVFVRDVVVVAVILYAFLVTFILFYSPEEENSRIPIGLALIDTEYYQVFGHSNLPCAKDASFAKIYSRESNEGYQKKTSQQGDFVFTSFVRTGEHDGFHPDFLCFVDYVGNEPDNPCYGIAVNFYDNTMLQLLGHSSFPQNRKSFLLIGNMNKGDQIKIELSLLDEEKQKQYITDKHAYVDEIFNEKKSYNDSLENNEPLVEDYSSSSSCFEITLDR